MTMFWTMTMKNTWYWGLTARFLDRLHKGRILTIMSAFKETITLTDIKDEVRCECGMDDILFGALPMEALDVYADPVNECLKGRPAPLPDGPLPLSLNRLPGSN
jgi:hypothetical protein